MKVNKPGKLFDTELITAAGKTEVYKIFPLKFKHPGTLFFSIDGDEFYMNSTLKNKFGFERLFIEQLEKHKIKHRFTRKGKIEWLNIPSHYFNYESK
jgi:hypothetical protein